jgi:hypothetical protein
MPNPRAFGPLFLAREVLARIFHRSIILAVCHWMVLRGGDFGVFFARGA